MASFTSSKDTLVLDNDECLGYFPKASLMFTIFVNYIRNEYNPPKGDLTESEYCASIVQPYMHLFVSYLEKGAARPYLKEFIQKIYQLKVEGKIKKIVMYTAASNILGWVTFLSKLIPAYAGVPFDFYDVVLHRSSTVYSRRTYLKSLRIVDTETSKIVMIDDSVENIMKYDGTVIQISKYMQHVELLEHNFMDFIDEKYHEVSLNAIENDKKYDSDVTTSYSSDRELLTILEILIQLFN